MSTLTRAVAAVAMAGAVCVAPTGAHAVPNFQAQATPAIADGAFAGSAGGHAFYFFPAYESGKAVNIFGSSRFVFQDHGDFVADANGQATLTGTIYQGTMQADRQTIVNANTDRAFEVELMFDYRAQGAAGQGSGGPKKELPGGAYSTSGGPVDTGLWDYWNLSSGTLEGVTNSAFEGLSLKLTQRPSNAQFPLQSGDGANNKNAEQDGLSGWFDWEVTGNANNYQYQGYNRFGQKTKKTLKVGSLGQGDVNVEFGARVPPDQVPEPASLLLLGIGLAAATRSLNKRR